MNKAEKIEAEIERRYEYWKEKESNSHSIESESRMSECQHLLLLFNSLQENPVSNDLEAAARKAATWHSRVEGDKFFPNDYQKFIAGAQWQKEQMIDKVCKWLVKHWREYVWLTDNDIIHFGHWEHDFKQAMEE